MWAFILLLVHTPFLYSQTFEHGGILNSAGGTSHTGSFILTGSLGETIEGNLAIADPYTTTGGFISTLDIDIDAPSITHTSITSVSEEQPVTVSAEVTDKTGVDEVVLHYRKGGETGFSSIPMNAVEDDTYEATIPGNDVTSRGIDYFITARDPAGRISREPRQGYNSITVSISNVVNTQAQPSGTAQNAYRLISVPVNANNKNAAVMFSDILGSYDITRWRLFELLPDQSYIEFPATSPLEPGRGFWLIVAESGVALETGPATSIRTDEVFEIPLNAGWTFIGSPYNFPVPLENVSIANEASPDIRTFTGSWTGHNNPLQPFTGYAVHSEEETTLRINPDISSSTASKSIASEKDVDTDIEWQIQIIAETQNARDHDNWVVVRPDASRGYDIFDRANPPVIGEYVDVYFYQPDWETVTPRYSTDARPAPDDGDIWQLKVRSNIADKIALTFVGIDDVPPVYEVWLLDDLNRVTQNLRKHNRYTLPGSTDHSPKYISLIIGTNDFVNDQFESKELIPDRFTLSQNYPNPFNPVTTIQFGLPRQDEITLTIFDVLGREIITLIENEEFQPGYHTVNWDARNAYGEPAASGIYLYQIRTSDYVETKRMILLK